MVRADVATRPPSSFVAGITANAQMTNMELRTSNTFFHSFAIAQYLPKVLASMSSTSASFLAIEGRHVFITGGSGGVGSAAAREFLGTHPVSYVVDASIV